MMRWEIGILLMVVCSIAFTQSPILDQAIQVVRNWLGDPQAEVYFSYADEAAEDLSGPRNEYVFDTTNYIISVNINTMKVVSWTPNLIHYMEIVQSDRSLLSDEQLKNIALFYASQYFPHWNEYPNWEVISIFKAKFKSLDRKKEAWFCAISLRPYFINDLGTKIPFLATCCDVRIDPYSGNVVGFGYDYMPMTITNLRPAFSPEDAKRRVEQAFLNMGAAQASAIWSATGFPYEDLPDGLVLGATQTSGLRLAYAFDYVLTVGTSETEDQFGTLQMPGRFRAAIDAHTGELFFYESLPGRRLASEKDKKILLEGLKKNISKSKSDTLLESNILKAGWQIWMISLMVMGLMFLLSIFLFFLFRCLSHR